MKRVDGGGTVQSSARRGKARRLPLAAAVLLPAAADLIQTVLTSAGSGAWLCPLLALPIGIFLCWTLGETGAQQEEHSESANMGTVMRVIYLIWGMILLFFSMASYSRRLILGLNGTGSRALFVLVSVVLVLYVSRSSQVLLRASHLFFPPALLALAAGLFLAFPAVRLENLSPIGTNAVGTHGCWGLALGAVQVVSLAGYVVYVRFLPREGERVRGEGTVLTWGGCGVLMLLLLCVLGAFGAKLALRMDEPYFYLMGGGGLAGGVRRLEAVLITVGAVGDLTRLALLSQACAQLWNGVFPGEQRAGMLPVAAALLTPLLLPEQGRISTVWTTVLLPAGNLLLGVAVPLLMMSRERKKRKSR